jgi:hypothetical protein
VLLDHAFTFLRFVVPSAGDPQGERVTQVAYDNACGLSRYIFTRDPQAAKSVILIHDR